MGARLTWTRPVTLQWQALSTQTAGIRRADPCHSRENNLRYVGEEDRTTIAKNAMQVWKLLIASGMHEDWS